MIIDSIYLPPEGKYKPVPATNRSSYGYPWQYNPLRHKCMSEERFCGARYVSRRYSENKIIYTRNPQQLETGAYSYYLYNEEGVLAETGEVILPAGTKIKDIERHRGMKNATYTAFIRSFPRTNVMTVAYTRTWNSGIHGFQLAGLRYYPLLDAATPLDEAGQYITSQHYTLYSFSYNDNKDVDVHISLHLQQVQQTVSSQPEAAVENTNIINPSPGTITVHPEIRKNSAQDYFIMLGNTVKKPFSRWLMAAEGFPFGNAPPFSDVMQNFAPP